MSTGPHASMASGSKPCAQCGGSLDEASLLLVCSHHLCLRCAAATLEPCPPGGKSQHVLKCRLCSAVTCIEEGAATYLMRLKLSSVHGTTPPRLGASPRSSLDVLQVSCSDEKMPSVRSVSPATESTRASATTQPSWRDEGQRPASSAVASVQHGLTNQTPRPSHSIASVTSSPRTLDADWLGRSEATPPSTPDGHRRSQVAYGCGRGECGPRAVRQCGQCTTKPADLYCEQCDELFCSACAQAIHKRGKLAQHRLRFHFCGGPDPSSISRRPSVASLSESVFGGRAQGELQTLRRPFLACALHPTEPIQFFCLRCECPCICAECALHGDHRGHEVLNIRAAMAQLPERKRRLQGQLTERSAQVQAILEESHAGRRHLAELSTRVRQGLRDHCAKLRGSLRHDSILACLEEAATEVVQRLEHRDDTAASIRAAHAQLLAHHRSGDAVQALTSYAKLRNILATAPPSQIETFTAAALEDKALLQQRIEERVAGIEALAQRIHELTPASVTLRAGMLPQECMTLCN
mmetsp:Transcript_51412/g.95083  ORF Transcript_51412/g.95083 Transcript_51412/m.95083 type:complete len:524 (+) Transcript_51412:35-1606(+)